MQPLKSRSLVFFFQPDCHFCHEVAPFVDEFEAKYGTEIAVLRLNIQARPEWTIGGWSPSGSPAFAYTENRALVASWEGPLDLQGMEAMVTGRLAPQRRRRS